MVDMKLTLLFYHVRGVDAMTNEELATAIQQGERGRLPELWEQGRRFAWQKASGAADTREDVEDYYQAGYIALDRAARSFDAGRGMSFVGWYAYHLKTAFAEAGGYRTPRQARDLLRHAASLDVPLSDDGATLGELLPDDSADSFIQQAEQAQLYAAVRRAVAALPSAERAVIVARYWHCRTLEEIGRERGIGAERVRQIEGAALRRLRHPLNNREIRAWL